MGRRLWAFCKDRRGGAMLYSGAFGLMLMASVGTMMTNYAWQEAQHEELRGALRAAISASSRLLAEVSDTNVQAQIKSRIADFMRGLQPGLEVDDDDITITHNATTQETWITIGGSAKYAFSNLWGGGGGGSGTVQLPSLRVGVALDSSRYEIAVAADVSYSMRGVMPSGGGTRMEALRSALGVAIDVLEDQVDTNPGSMSAAILPFGNVVNVADTSGSGQTEGKRRYARILTGAAVTSTSVSAAAKATDHHYYDMYASYGRGLVDMTPLISKKLPITETTADWDLRAAESIDVAALMPGSGATWAVNGKDFWNGCVMARWGAYWNADARPSTWDSTALDNNASLYPATANVAAWSTGGTALQNQPLHISDAPPDSASPNTRFRAYSFPDSSIGGTADARIEAVLKETLTDGSVVGTATTPGALISTTTTSPVSVLAQMRGFNDWGRTNQSGETQDGDALCGENAILPLTDDAADLRTYTSSLTNVPRLGRASATYLHLGIVWGVRALSPLWRSVWNVSSAQGTALPLTPCVGNNTANCAQDLKKIIVILSDGGNVTGIPADGRASRGRLPSASVQTEANVQNPLMTGSQGINYSLCGAQVDGIGMLPTGTGGATWQTAAEDTGASDFNGRFTGQLDADKTFSTTASTALANDWRTIVDPNASNALRDSWADWFDLMTPWEVFRGEKMTIASTACSVADAFAGKTPTGCGRPGEAFGLDGRPTQRPPCRRSIPFGAYGNVDDFMRIGDQDVVAGASPFQSDTAWTLTTNATTKNSHTKATLDGWMDAACEFANDRDVSIVGVYLGLTAYGQRNINFLEACVDKAGGSTGVQDVHVAPTKAALETAFREIFTIRSSLRFLN